MSDALNKLWIAEAPLAMWSSGPIVIWDLSGDDAVERYKAMGWTVRGPYLLEEALPMEARAALP